jgi:type IX secretion system PorP/SprF family membrane protein
MKRFFTLILGMSALQVFAQQDPLYSQYMFNPIVINPGYAGSRNVLTVTLHNRYQWVGIEGAPRTLTLSVHSPLRNDHVALGGYVYSYKLGPTIEYGVMGNYVYRIDVGQGRLAFGLQAGFVRLNIDWDKTTVHDEEDPFYTNRPTGRMRPDANLGIYYFTPTFYVGLSSKHLFENIISPVSTTDQIYADLTRHFYLVSGYAWAISDDFVLKPSTLIKYAKNAPVNVDFNVTCLMKKTVEMGVSYRTVLNAIVILAEFHVGKGLTLGYSYDAAMNEIRNYSNGSHEIMISYDFKVGKEQALKYF